VNKSTLLFFSSFESKGNHNLNDWKVPPENAPNLHSFSNDVPESGGVWSLRLQGTQDGAAYSIIETNVSIANPDSPAVYILSYWAKGKGITFFRLTNSDSGWVSHSSFLNADWRYYSDTLIQYNMVYNTLTIELFASSFDSLSSAKYDNVSITKIIN
jgi:hypothetical protein